MKTNIKKFSPLSKFIYWIILFIIICIIGVTNVFADEKVNIGYVTDHTNLVLINKSFGMTSDLPVNQVSTQNFSITQIDLYISYSFGANNVYLLELSTPNAILQNINEVSIVAGDTYCSFLGLDISNANYPNIKFSCPNSVNLLSVSLSNSSGNSITSSNSFRWNYTYLSQIKSTIDIGPIINNQTQNTQDIINNNNQNTDKIIDKLSENDVDTSKLDTVGWLPSGPVDSILNLPLNMLNGLNNSLSKSCAPLNVNLPYVNKTVEIPCLNTIYDQIKGLNTFYTWIGGIFSVLILYKYLLTLYKWVDDTLTFRENNHIDNWGGV